MFTTKRKIRFFSIPFLIALFRERVVILRMYTHAIMLKMSEVDVKRIPSMVQVRSVRKIILTGGV